MLSIKIICVGKLKERFFLEAAAEYQKRLGSLCRLEIEELPEARLSAEPTEAEVDAKSCFKSHFMSDFLRGRESSRVDAAGRPPHQDDLFSNTSHPNPDNPVKNNSAASAPPRLCVKECLSPAARAVLDAGRELWRYYHAQPGANPNASYYDIRAHFQGCKPNGTMNAKSDDATYNAFLAALRAAHKVLAAQIEPKVYEYGFLKR